MKDFVLEVCVDSLESARAAEEGGATRLELCSNLIIGGTTPGMALFEAVKREVHIPVHVLIRPRYGDFLYSEAEFALMQREVEYFSSMGAEGIVIGCLSAGGVLDEQRMQDLIGRAGSLHITLHRAFDMCRDPFEALKTAVDMGTHTVLTSGQCSSCLEGRETIGRLAVEAAGRIDILAGGGVSAEVISAVLGMVPISSFHMSAKRSRESGMSYRKEGLSMGLAGLSEYELWLTDASLVRAARTVLENA